jgi:hypothetical protein
MRNIYGIFVAILLVFATLIYAAATITDNTNVATPTGGESSNQSLTGLANQYVGFYGNVSIQVRNNTAGGNILYNKPVNSGKVYFLKNGEVIPNTLVNATANSTADGVIGLTGAYGTASMYDSRQDACGITNVSKLNTTDNRMTGLLSNLTNDQYLFCTDIGSFTSTNGFGTINYEIVVPKTGTFAAYDIWFDLS